MKQSLYENELQTLMMKRNPQAKRVQNEQIYLANYKRAAPHPSKRSQFPENRQEASNEYFMTTQDEGEHMGTIGGYEVDENLRNLERARRQQETAFTENQQFLKKFEGINRIIRNSVARK